MDNLLIVGETNNGKTALIDRFWKSSGIDNSPSREVSHVPVLLVQAPPVPDERRFVTALLDSAGIIHGRHERMDDMYRQIQLIMPKLGVRMLIIDEVHHALAGSGAKQHAFLNVIKYLGNELRITIVGVGTKLAFNALYSDDQLANRFKPVPLPRWQPDVEYRRLLKSFERVIPLQTPSQLDAPPMASRLHSMSGGLIGETSSVLSQAAIAAIRGGEEQITDNVLDRLKWVSPSERRQQALAII
jgi:hypothetical protein